MCIFKKYKDIFGKPSEGLHKYRIFNLAIIDIIVTILFAWFFSFTFKYSFLWCLLILFLLGIILHRLFCVRTTIDKLLFG